MLLHFFFSIFGLCASVSPREINCPIAAEKAKSPIVKCKPTGNKDEIYGTTLSDKTF